MGGVEGSCGGGIAKGVKRNDFIGVFSSWAIQIYKLVTQEYKNSILDIIDRPQWWKTTIIFCKCYVHVLYSLCFCLSRKVIISLYLR